MQNIQFTFFSRQIMSSNSPLSPSRSVESGLDKTPMRTRGANVKTDDWVFATPEKPIGSSKNNRKVLGSIERGLDKMKNMLTPRKHRLSSTGEGPAIVTGKNLCNVSTTSHHNPDYVLNELTRALVSIFKITQYSQEGHNQPSELPPCLDQCFHFWGASTYFWGAKTYILVVF